MRRSIAILCLLSIVSLAGCFKTPDAVIAAAHAEADLIGSYKKFVDDVLEIAYSDLENAINEQIEIIIDYEVVIRAQGDNIAVAQVVELLNMYRAKKREIAERLKAVRGLIREADTTIAQAQQLHSKMLSYLARETVEMSDFRSILDDIRSAYKRGVK